MSRHADKSIRHRPVCPECDTPMGRVSRVVRKLVDDDTMEVRRTFRCLRCPYAIVVKTRVTEVAVA